MFSRSASSSDAVLPLLTALAALFLSGINDPTVVTLTEGTPFGLNWLG